MNEDGELCTAGGAGSGGDASEAEQEIQSGILTDIETAVDGLETLGAAAIPAGNNNIGDVDVASGAIGLSAPTTGGCTIGKTLSAASTNATSVKGSAGTLCSLTVINTTATIYYLKFYNKATAATCNSDAVLQTIPIPASTSGAGVDVNTGPYGWAFATGITFCLTGGLADNDNTSAATGVAINYSYK